MCLAVVVVVATVAGAPIVDTASAAENGGCQAVSAPETITESGCYVLTGSATMSTGNGITINTSDVVLDGQGHTLSGNVLGDGVVVHDGASTLTNVTVRNLTLTGWHYGVRYEGVDGGRVANVTVQDSQGGVVLLGDSSDWGTGSGQVTGNVVVADSTVSNNNVGVYATYSDDNEIRDVVADGNSINGIQLHYTRDVVVSNVTARTNDENGIRVEGSARATVANSTTTDNGQEGVWLGGSSGSAVTNNTASGNEYGVHLGNADGNTVTGNRLWTNSEGGLSVYNSGTNLIYDNYVNGTNYVEFTPTVQPNTWNVSERTGTNVLGGPTVGGNVWATPDGTGFSQTCTDADGDGICDSPFVVNGSQVDALPLAIDQPANDDPTASFTVSPSTPTVGYDVWFDGNSSGDADGTIAGYAWDFDGDGTTDATGETTTHNFSTTGDHDVTLEVTDDAGATDVVTKTVTVLPDGPEVTVTPATVDFENVSLYASATKQVTVSNDGSDPLLVERTLIAGADAGAYSVTDGGATFTVPSRGSAAVNVTFAPTAAATQTATLDLGTNDTDESSVDVSLTGRGLQPVTDAPVAVPDHFVHRGGEDLVVTTSDLLANDFDADGDALSLGTYTTPTNGTFSVDDGNFTYRPDPGFSGTDAFRYRVVDEDGTLSPFATVRVDVLATPYRDPVTARDTYYTFENESLSVEDPGILGNDYDPDGGTLDIGVYVPATNGTVSLSDGSFVYTPDPGFTGIDEFTYRAMDDNGGLAPLETVSIRVFPDPNRVPVTRPDTYTVVENGSLSVDAPGLLANDYDPEGTNLTIDSWGVGANGFVGVDDDGSFGYTPRKGFSGTDSFTYRAADEDGGVTTTETVTIEVVPEANRVPVTTPDAYAVVENGSLSVDAPGLLANDYDPEGDTLTIDSWGVGANGSVGVDDDGSFSYTPEKGFSGTDSFTYRAADEDGGVTTTETVTIEVVPQTGSTPITSPDAATVVAGETLSDATSVLRNDYHPAGDALSVGAYTTPTNGSLSLQTDGTFTYTPDPGFVGTDSFSYRAVDGDGDGSAFETVSVTVLLDLNQKPVTRPDTYTVVENGSLSVDGPGLLINDYDPEGTNLSIETWGTTSNASIRVTDDGGFSYTPDPGFTGTDEFAYRAADEDGRVTTTETVTVEVVPEVNRVPVTTPDTYMMVENGSLSVEGDGLLTNDYDPAGDNLTIETWGTTSNAYIRVTDDGGFSYTPDPGFIGTDEFSYRAADEDGHVTSTETVTIVVRPNGAPVTRPDEYVTAVGRPLTVAAPGPLLNDVDFGGDALSATVVADPSNGTLTAAKNGQFTYAPDPGFVGVDSFTYRVVDARGATTEPTRVTITVVDPAGQADAATSHERVDFGTVEAGSTDVIAISVTNVGGADLAISDVRIDGADASAFAVIAGDAATSLATAESHTVLVQAAPTGAGDRTARLVVSTNDADRRVLWIPLYATGDASGSGGSIGIGGGSGGSSPGSGDEGTGDSGADGDGGDPNATPITVTRDGDWTNVSVAKTNGTGFVNVTFADSGSNESDVRLLGMAVETDADSDLVFNVTSEEEPSENTTDFHALVGGEALGYLRIDHSVPDENVSGVTLDFFVPADRLAELGVASDDVVLYRYHGGEWTDLPTRLVRSENGGYVMQADSPGLSTFAIARPPAAATTPSITQTQPNDDPPATSRPETTAVPDTDATGFGFGLMGLVALALLVYLGLRQRWES